MNGDSTRASCGRQIEELAETLLLLTRLRHDPGLLRELLEDLLARDLVPLWTEIEQLKRRPR